MSELRGCTDGNCIIRKPEGMHTNGGCGCERELRHALGLQDSRRFIHALRERQREVAALREALHTLHNHATSFRAYCRGESPSLFTDEDHNVIDFDDAMARADAALKPHAQEHGSPK